MTQQFDRCLHDFREDVAKANTTVRDSVSRYVAMMDALDSAFLLFYDRMPEDEQIKMRAAFYKLADTVRICTPDDEPTTNIHPLNKKES